MNRTVPFYGLMAEFNRADDLVAATESTRLAGYTYFDAHSPFPVEGLSDAMGFHTRLPLIVLIGGIVGALLGYFMQYWMNAVDYPINVGGRPLHSWPAFIPVTFEVMVLVAGLTAVVAMLALNGLPKPYHPVFNVQRFDLASNDRFFLVIEADDPMFEQEKTKQFLLGLNPRDVYVVES